jgi:hypothetical protein
LVGLWARAELRHETPENWQEFIDTAALDELIELTVKHSVAVLWVPRAAIVLELLQAESDAERDRILVEREAQILDDVESILATISRPELADPARAAREAAAAARDGHHMAAQTLVGSTVTHLVNVRLGHKRFSVARDVIRKDEPDAVALRLLRRTTLLHGLANAIEHTDHACVGFNRNSTAGHEGLFEQCTQANCVRGLLLLAGLIKDFDVRPPNSPGH